jgi:MFS family permease
MPVSRSGRSSSESRSELTWRRRLLIAALASLSATAALAIGILLFGEFGDTQLRVLATTFSISLYSLLTLPGALLYERRDARPLALATIAAAALAFALALALIWGGDDNETLWRLAGTVSAAGLGLAQVAAMTSRRRGNDAPAVRRVFVAATAVITVVVAMAVLAIWTEPDDEWYFRALAALGVLDVFLVILQPLLRRLGGRDDAAVTAVLEGTREQIDEALRRVDGTGVRVRR